MNDNEIAGSNGNNRSTISVVIVIVPTGTNEMRNLWILKEL